MEKPYVNDVKLGRIIDRLYRPNARIGSGSTADAIRYELATGEPILGKYHSSKAVVKPKSLLEL